MHYSVSHKTIYSYTDPVALCQNQIHLTPRGTASQDCLEFELSIKPEPVVRRKWIDYFGNEVWYFSIEEPHHELSVTGQSRVVVREPVRIPPDQTPAWETVRDQLGQGRAPEPRLAAQYCFASRYIMDFSEAGEYAAPSFSPHRPLLEAALDLMQRIHTDFKYVPASTKVSTSTADVLRLRCGVCQDFAHLQITCLRSLGLAARYVSGYLLTDPPAGQPRMVGADASHAWLSIYCPGIGWIDLDPTNNVIPGERHVTVAWGRDYGDVCPIQGVITGGGDHVITVAVDVSPLSPAPSFLL